MLANRSFIYLSDGNGTAMLRLRPGASHDIQIRDVKRRLACPVSFSTRSLKINVCVQLHQARPIRAGQLPEARVGDIGNQARQHRMIQRIEHIRSELQVQLLGNREILAE